MDFKTVNSLIIPEGEVTQIADASGSILWKKQSAEEYTIANVLTVAASTKIDTGIKIAPDDYIYVDFIPSPSSSYGTIWYAGTSKIMRVYIDGLNIQAKIDWYNQTMQSILPGSRYNVTFVNQIVTLHIYSSGDEKTTNMSAVPSFTPDTNLMLGGVNKKWKFYGMKHGKSADELDLDYVPAIRNSDGTVGIYDKITKTFKAYGTAAT